MLLLDKLESFVYLGINVNVDFFVKSKLSNYDSLSDVNHLDNLANWEFHHVELKYYKLKDKLLDIAKKETIEIFEDHNIDYFIKYYNITFYKDTKIFEIEI